MEDELHQLFQKCVVRLRAELAGRIEAGTGFFIAPRLLLTCKHVVKKDAGDCAAQHIQVYWQNQEYQAEIHQFSNGDLALSTNHDLAILKLVSANCEHPCVHLGTKVNPGDPLSGYGYPKKLADEPPDSESLFAISQGRKGEDGQLFTFIAEGTRSGFSGAPLLNQKTGKVCGLIKSERSALIDEEQGKRKLRLVWGGVAVPTTVILAEFPEVKELQQHCHQADQQWISFSSSSSSHELEVDWHKVCFAMLANHRQLTTNQLMHDKDDRFELDEVHVPLALVERKKPDKHDGETSAEQGSRFYEPQYEEKQRFEHKQFLLDVLKNGKNKSQGRRIAIIGQPGAGKTTLLSKIAFWVLKETEDFPILISLADLPEANSKQEFLEQYLLNKWLKMALPYISPNAVEVTEALKEKLIQLCNQGKVWLLLDGVDEMPTQGGSSHLSTIYSQLSGWVGQARVVLTCRLNVWEANPSLLPDNFETYRTLEFSYGDSRTADQVKEFISKWFKREPQLGEQLRQALDTPGKERIKDLVKNPLRLAMLCSTWNRWREHGGLPDTKAKLYKGYVDKFYEWKHNNCPTNERQRRKLNKALRELSKWAIDQPTSRFRIRLSQIPKALVEIFGYEGEEGSLLWYALKLGWLNNVGVAVENPDKEVYAFFHPTFQEYFAALEIEDWDFFLPRAHDNHNPKPVSERYRIFEPQ